MENLIPIQENNGKRAVSARDLHTFLESKRDFSNWIKDRIEKYDLVENVDYVSFNKIVERETGASTRIEYALTIDAAKELSMIEGNEKGKRARRYFIECEKVAKGKTIAANTPKPMSDSTLFNLRMKAVAWTAKMLNLSEESKLRMIQAVTEPLGLPSPNYVSSKGAMHSATYLLKQKGNPTSVVAFNGRMLANGYLEEKERPSKSKGTSRFKCLTEKGLMYRENEVCPKNVLETQPHYYDNKFDELLGKLGVNTKNTED